MIDKYRHIFFNSPIGLEVLTDLLTELGFGSTLDPDKPYQIHQHNLAIVLLAKCGVFGKGTLDDVVTALSCVMPKKEEQYKEEIFTDLHKENER